eukprot:5870958-Pleurochrysis_carterae.AAC.1
MAKAGVFWLLHAGHRLLPGRGSAYTYASYRTEATLIRSRATKFANLEHARAPVPPEEGNQTRPVEQPPPDPH